MAAAPLTAEDHARTMAEYSRAGEERARGLGNRGPIRLYANGRLAQDILDAYWTHGFYVFEGVAGPEELAELLRWGLVSGGVDDGCEPTEEEKREDGWLKSD